MQTQDTSNVLLLEIDLSSHKSIGLFILTIDLQYNAPGEIIPTYYLREPGLNTDELNFSNDKVTSVMPGFIYC